MQLTLGAIRKNYSLTAKEVSAELGIHQQTLLKYENDSSNIPLSLLKKISDYYHVGIDEIFLGKKYDLKRNIKNKAN